MSELCFVKPKYKKISDLMKFLEEIKNEKGDLEVTIDEAFLWPDTDFSLGHIYEDLTDAEQEFLALDILESIDEAKLVGYSFPRFFIRKEGK